MKRVRDSSGDAGRVSLVPPSTAPISTTGAAVRKVPLAIRWVFPAGRMPEVTPLSSKRIRLGRDPENDAVLEGAAISRFHAEIERRGSAVAIRDLESRNGVHVNGLPVTTAPLSPGSVLRLGDWVGIVTRMDDTRSGVWEVAPELWGSGVLERAVADSRRAATSSLNVLVLGETGTGKELLARAVHRWSGRTGQFIAVNCAALTDSLLEAELFGHERGAFTGADRARRGHVREADGGLLFLDEVAELSLPAQAKLLRVLQEREVTPVGSSQRIPVDLRVLSATHVDLRQSVSSGQFRADLFARLEGVTVTLPALRERREDVVNLFVLFVERMAQAPCPKFNARFAEQLACHDWPRNVRELRQLAERMSVLHGSSSNWRGHHLALAHPEFGHESEARTDPAVSPRPSQPRRLQRSEVEAALVATGGNVARAARSLAVAKQTLYDFIQTNAIDLATIRDGAEGAR